MRLSSGFLGFRGLGFRVWGFGFGGEGGGGLGFRIHGFFVKKLTQMDKEGPNKPSLRFVNLVFRAASQLNFIRPSQDTVPETFLSVVFLGVGLG